MYDTLGICLIAVSVDCNDLLINVMFLGMFEKVF